MPSATYLFCACLRLVSPLSPPPFPSPSAPTSFLPRIDIIAKLFGFYFLSDTRKKSVMREKKMKATAIRICHMRCQYASIAHPNNANSQRNIHIYWICVLRNIYPSDVAVFCCQIRCFCWRLESNLWRCFVFRSFLFWVLRAFTENYVFVLFGCNSCDMVVNFRTVFPWME